MGRGRKTSVQAFTDLMNRALDKRYRPKTAVYQRLTLRIQLRWWAHPVPSPQWVSVPTISGWIVQ